MASAVGSFIESSRRVVAAACCDGLSWGTRTISTPDRAPLHLEPVPMSVLAEAFSVIIPRRILEATFPGGSDAYLQAAVAEDVPSRFVCADEYLTAVSFGSPEDAAILTDRLAEFGLVEVEDDRACEIACVDQTFGPTAYREWLKWYRHDDGFNYCWLTGSEPGDLAAPGDWRPEQSRQVTRRDPHGAP